MGVVAVIHDLSMAVRCFPGLILLDDGMVVGDGPSLEVLSVDTINVCFECRRGFTRIRNMGRRCCGFQCRGARQSHGSGRALVGAICVGGAL